VVTIVNAAAFLSIAIPIAAIICLVLVLQRDPGVGKSRPTSVPVLPKSPLSRQVWKATRPARTGRPTPAKPKTGPLPPAGTVAPFRRPPRERAG
jgi:hypothetical protein